MIFSAHEAVVALLVALGAGVPEPAVGPVRVARELLSQRDAELSIGDAALRLSTLVNPDASLAQGRATLDRLAGRVATLVGTRTDPDFRIRAINTVLFREERFAYDKRDAMSLNPTNGTLSGLLASHQGNCVSMPLLWFAVAERLGYPVFAVTAPQHLFIRYDDGSFRRNIEATSGGGSASDERIIRELEVPPAAVASGSMMRSLSKRGFLVELIAEAGVRELRARNLGLAESLLSLVLEYDAKNLAAHYNLAVLYSARAAMETSFKEVSSDREQAQRARQESLGAAALKHAATATSLGAVPPLNESYLAKVSRVAGSELDGIKSATSSFELARYLQPGGKPIMVRVADECRPPDPQPLRERCAAMCGPLPGNLCAGPAGLPGQPEAPPVPGWPVWSQTGVHLESSATTTPFPPHSRFERAVTEDGFR